MVVMGFVAGQGACGRSDCSKALDSIALGQYRIILSADTASEVRVHRPTRGSTTSMGSTALLAWQIFHSTYAPKYKNAAADCYICCGIFI